MKFTKKILALILSAFLICFSLAACSSSSHDGVNASVSDNSISNIASNSYGSKSVDSNHSDTEYMEEDTDNTSHDDQKATEQGEVKGEKTKEKLVYTCNIDIETTDYAETIKSVNEQINKFNGIIEHQTERNGEDTWYYSDYVKTTGAQSISITVRIPSAKYESFLDSLDGTGKIRNKTMDVQNISDNYYDTKATIEALETQQTRLLEMLKNTNSVDDMITIESRLATVESELNSYRSSLGRMDTDVAYSTVNLNIDEVIEYSKDAERVKTNTFFDRLKNTIKESWHSFLDFLEGLLFLIIRAFPILLVLGVIATAIAIPIVKSSKKRKEKRENQPAKTQTTAQEFVFEMNKPNDKSGNE